MIWVDIFSLAELDRTASRRKHWILQAEMKAVEVALFRFASDYACTQ